MLFFKIMNLKLLFMVLVTIRECLWHLHLEVWLQFLLIITI